MAGEYIESEKVWRTADLDITYSGLGQAILAKLKNDDPQRILEVHYDSGTQLSVDDVRRQTITIAENLMRLGVKKGDIVVLYSVVNPRVTPITFACYTIGAPINFFETTFEGDAISHTLKLLDPVTIIYEEQYKSQLFGALERLKPLKLKHILSIDSEKLLAPVNIETFQPPDIGDPFKIVATLMLTSGSTGLPKVVGHYHAMMMQGLYSWWKLTSNCKIFCFSPLRWISQVSLMMQPVFFGVQRIYTSKPPSGLFGQEIIDTYKVTHFFTVPAIYIEVLRAAEQLKDSSSLSSLRTALIGGEVVSDSLIALSAKIAQQCRVIKCYGMTELAGCIASDELISKRGVNGGALKNGLMAKIIDDNGKSLGPNEMGQLCLKSTIPFLGYFKNEKANKEAFLDDGWLNTGDYGFMDSENLLNIVTRHKYLLRSAGIIVIPNNVENIINKHPNVLTSVLIGSPSAKNPAEKILEVGTVFVILRNNTFVKDIENELMDFIRDKLTKEQLQIVRYVKVISEMPVTSCGKVDRIALKEMAKGA